LDKNLRIAYQVQTTFDQPITPPLTLTTPYLYEIIIVLVEFWLVLVSFVKMTYRCHALCIIKLSLNFATAVHGIASSSELEH